MTVGNHGQHAVQCDVVLPLKQDRLLVVPIRTRSRVMMVADAHPIRPWVGDFRADAHRPIHHPPAAIVTELVSVESLIAQNCVAREDDPHHVDDARESVGEVLWLGEIEDLVVDAFDAFWVAVSSAMYSEAAGIYILGNC